MLLLRNAFHLTSVRTYGKVLNICNLTFKKIVIQLKKNNKQSMNNNIKIASNSSEINKENEKKK